MDRTHGSFRVSGAFALRAGVAAATLALAGGAQAATPSFVDATDAAGVTWTYGLDLTTGGARMHGGGTVADFNGDGYPDIFVIGGGLDNDQLFINQGDGTFTEEAAAWGLTDLYKGGGAAAADYDGDGDMDLFVTSMGDMPDPKDGEHKLYQNTGTGSFVNVADAAGVAFNHTSNKLGTNTSFDGYSATWGDYDLDGDLDLWFGGWHSQGNPNDTNQTTLYRNDGDGTFTDVTATSGVFDESPGQPGNVGPRAFGGIFADMNGDRYPELLVAGDFGSSRYFVNNRDGTFTKVDIFGSNRVHNGMGTAVGDYNRDGLTDWFITAIDPSYLGADNDGNRMMQNTGNHTFLELPSADGFDEIGIRDGGWGWGATMKDLDHDGWEDIAHTNGWIIWGDCGESQGREVPPGSCDGTGTDPVTGTQFHNITTRLFRNNQDGTFSQVEDQWGLDHRLQGRGLYQFDYDKDGDLDLFSLNYVEWSPETDIFCALDGANKSYCTPEAYQGTVSRLYRNDGERFTDVTESAGVHDDSGKALGIVCFDFDGDGWDDVFVANDTQPNFLFHNEGDGTFTEQAMLAGVAFDESGKAQGAMGVDFADYDHSGHPSLVVGNFSNEMLAMYHNEQGGGLFIDTAPTSAVGQRSLLTLAFGTSFLDFDLDGNLDIFVANGHVEDEIQKVQESVRYAQPPHLFRNLGSGRFDDVAPASPALSEAMVGRGSATADYDGDGDLDILVTTKGGAARLFRNDGAQGGRAVRIDLVGGHGSNPDGFGARVELTAGGRRQISWARAANSYCSQSEPTVTFGLGAATEADEVVVYWPSGKVSREQKVAAGSRLTIEESKATAES